MRLAELTSYTSRLNAGIFYALTALLPRVAAVTRAEVRVYGSADAHTEEDRRAWGPLRVDAFKPWPPAVLGYSPRLLPELSHFRPEIIHTHGLWTYASLASLRLHRRTGAALIVSPHGMLDPWALRLSRLKKRVVSTLFQNAQLRAATVIHALTEAEARDFRAYGLNNPVVVIPNGVNVPSLSTELDTRPSGRRRLLFLGRIHPKKGLDCLLDAWAQVKASQSMRGDWELVIAGWDDGGHQQHLEARVAQLGLESEVSFLGPVFGERKQEVLEGCDGFVLTSHSEGLPMAVLEAWAHRKPALISRACNLPDAVAAGAAIEVDVSVDSVAAGLARFLGLSVEERQGMGEAGLRLVQTRFSWDRIAGDFGRVYQALAAGGPPPADLLYRG